jgi:hypothetical protein
MKIGSLTAQHTAAKKACLPPRRDKRYNHRQAFPAITSPNQPIDLALHLPLTSNECFRDYLFLATKICLSQHLHPTKKRTWEKPPRRQFSASRIKPCTSFGIKRCTSFKIAFKLLGIKRCTPSGIKR